MYTAERRCPLVDWSKRVHVDVMKERGQVVNRNRHDVVEQNQARQLGSEFRHIFAVPPRREAIHQLAGVSSCAGFEIAYRSRTEKRIQHPSPGSVIRGVQILWQNRQIPFGWIQQPAIRAAEGAPVRRTAPHVLVTIKNVVARSNLTVGDRTCGDEMFEDILELFCERRVFDVELLPKPVEMVRLGHHVPPLAETSPFPSPTLDLNKR